MKKHLLFFISILLFYSITVDAQSWGLKGNSGTNPPTNFLGTTDKKAFVIKTNNAERMRILSNGQVGIGITNPLQKLHVKGSINIDSGFALYIANHAVLSVDSSRGNTYLGNGIAVNTIAYYNTANGFQALSNNSGYYNTASGSQALFANYVGSSNTANGFQALYSNYSGGGNTANGFQALFYNSGSYNTANGYQALYLNHGTENTASGLYALYSNNSGRANVASGSYALFNNSTGSENTSSGHYSLYENTTGFFNVADGGSALFNNSIGNYNTATGYGSMYNNTSGYYNTSVGFWALNQNYDSWYNVAIGTFAGSSTHGWNNTFVGANTSVTSSDIYNGTALGERALVTASNQVRIGNNYVTSIGGFANWSNISDGRVKKNVKQNVPGLAFINKLKPVTYNLDMDAYDKIVQPSSPKDKNGKAFVQKISQQEINARNAKQQIVYTGFVAQDVEKAAKELSYDFSGVDAAKSDKDVYGLRYSDFVVPLVKAVQELSVKNDSLQKHNDILQKQNDDFEKRIEKLEAIVNIKSSPSGINTPGVNISSASLEQNVPNPFTNSTTIRYTLPQRYAAAKIILTDKLGNVLKEVSVSTAGKGSVQIDASTLAKGSYQYSLIVDGKIFGTKQMVCGN